MFNKLWAFTNFPNFVSFTPGLLPDVPRLFPRSAELTLPADVIHSATIREKSPELAPPSPRPYPGS